jgi:hypothetical protein
MANKPTTFDFGALVDAIQQVNERLTAQAGRAVNISLTLRNWMIGCYIREYEQNGADRAQYGETLLGALSERLTEAGIEGMAARSLRLYRQFYLTYPQIWQTVSAKFPPGLLSEAIWQSLLVEYALAGMDNKLFVSKYQLELPRKEEIQRFLEAKMREVGDTR